MGLREKLERVSGLRSEPPFDAELAKQRWRTWVSQLFDQIESCFSDLVAEKKMKLDRVTREKHEELLGPYTVDVLRMEIGSQSFVFDPLGKHVIGANGRVDLYEIGNYRHSAMLLYFTDRQDEPGRWEIWEHAGARVPFSCEALDDLLTNWVQA